MRVDWYKPGFVRPDGGVVSDDGEHIVYSEGTEKHKEASKWLFSMVDRPTHDRKDSDGARVDKKL